MIILGGGLAGTAAAIAACNAGARDVTIVEKSGFPRHKVCGEFLSPEVLPILADLGLRQAFLDLQPALMRRAVLNFGSFGEKRFALPEPAYGLSRYALDAFLMDAAQARGAKLAKQAPPGRPDIVANGRVSLPSASTSTQKGQRLFGFKAHFTGECNDAVELYFFPGGYVGVNPAGGGITNVCGLAEERLLKQLDFSVESLISACPPLANRIASLKRQWEWLFVGPLVFENRLNTRVDAYYAGDAVSFVDPFTGSGMLGALFSGMWAGRCCAQGIAVEQYHREIARVLGQAFAASTLLRKSIWSGWGLRLAPWVPGKLLFWATRPKKVFQK